MPSFGWDGCGCLLQLKNDVYTARSVFKTESKFDYEYDAQVLPARRVHHRRVVACRHRRVGGAAAAPDQRPDPDRQ